MPVRAALILAAAALLIWGAPLLGLALSGRPIAPYLDFPPLAEPSRHAQFSWPVFVALAVPCLLTIVVLAAPIRRRHSLPSTPFRSQFAWWGALGLLLLATGWTFAWSEALVPPAMRRHTFAVIWLGYILAINAFTLRRCGECPLTHRTRWFLALFPASAVFWWLFEYLNQFVGNWYYVGVAATGGWQYVLQASVPFATVLPAIASTSAWLRSHLAFRALRPVHARAATAWIAGALGILALAGLGIWPELLFPALWLAPLLLVWALQYLLLADSTLAPLSHGDWRPLLEPALAGLVCGVLWELWNYGSAAKWHYAIPYVERFRLFEMPVLGYTGYLPFGVLCALVSDLVARLVRDRDVA